MISLPVFHSAKEYIRYRFRAGNAHGLHSPFVFELFNQVIKDDMPFYQFEPIEFVRRKLLTDPKVVHLYDLGAGGKLNPVRETTVKSIAARSVSAAKYGRLLFRLIHHFQPKTIVELGTSLGITTLYLSIPSSVSNVYTIEGSPEVLKIARDVFAKFNRRNIVSREGEFGTVLPELLKEFKTVDMAYVDGNHRYQPTIDYFHQLLEKTGRDSFMVFDDIYWSEEMTQAWNEIKSHPEVTVSIDLYRMGIVFFRQGILKQDFVLKY